MKRKRKNSMQLDLILKEGEQKLIEIKSNNETMTFKKFIRFMQEIWNYDTKDIEKWFNQKRKKGNKYDIKKRRR